MKVSCIFLLVYLLMINTVLSSPYCTTADWLHSFDHEGLSQCYYGFQFITGFYRFKTYKDHDIKYLEYASCCSGTGVWGSKREILTTFADWRVAFDSDYSWALCPSGYFLQGLFRGNGQSRLHNIEHGQCAKPADHPPFYGVCLKKNVGECMKNPGWCKCPDGYYVAGIRRGGGDGLHCLDYFKCCKMAGGPEPFSGVLGVQNRVMDVTLTEMATLANYLGFAWAHGCRAKRVGQGFQRDKLTWSASTVTLCSGDKNKERLQIAYEDWSFETGHITFGEPNITHLQPETVEGGEIHNRNDLEVVQKIWRTVEVARSVSHFTTQKFKQTSSLAASVSFTSKSPWMELSTTTTFTFGYEKGKKQTDKTGTVNKKIFHVTAKYGVKPLSAVRWSLRLFYIQSAVTYKAKIQVKFSATFKGFLRTGSLGKADLNFHNYFRRHGDKPRYSYKFGDSKTPFYEALQEESYYGSSPWLWGDLKLKYPKVKDLIKGLTQACRFSFRLEGKFVDVHGIRSNVYFQDIPVQKDFKRDQILSEEDRSTGKTESLVHTVQTDSKNPNTKIIQVLTAPNPDVFKDNGSH